jgi:hypothetical protein
MKKLTCGLLNGIWILFLLAVLAGAAMFIVSLNHTGSTKSALIFWPY